MDNKNNSPLPPQDFSPLYKIAAIAMAAGFLMVCFALAKMQHGFWKFGLIALGSILLAFGVLFILVISSAKKFAKQKHNYFLYDRKTRREIDVNSLTFSDIRTKIQKYMSIFKRGGRLYVGDLFNSDIQIPPAIRTLFCYELLYEISEGSDNDTRAATFLSFGTECAGIFYSYLSAAGETQLAEKIRHYFNEAAGGKDDAKESSEKFRKFLDANKKYLEAAIIKYTKAHIDEF